MTTATLSVIREIPADGRIHYLETQYRVTVERPLGWIKEHADEIASKANRGLPYVALYVQERP